MPELPEAETIARELATALTGRVLNRPIVVRADVVHGDVRLVTTYDTPSRRDLTIGRPRNDGAPGRVIDVGRRGKRVIVQMEHGARITFALGMTGSVTIEEAGAECAAHTHLRIPIGDGEREVRFCDPRRFGGVWISNGREPDTGRRLRPLGPEPLDVTASEFRRIMRRRRQVKALLMDQQALAGMGNIYCDESLHRAGIHPRTPASELTDGRVAALRRAIRSVLRSAIRFNGSTIMDYRTPGGREGSFQLRHRVYQREGLPCRTCRTPIERITAAGRSTHFCPRCQPPAPN
ncbi:MAG: bifunctional DNA-formamidopyrimidine glycosylase/DNA-(apurinic or apyrimidinic site) lyase [Phycisphaerales bacterium]|nr:bifunctional DNA-formamidopyrimidine glycosylase/DNA-(apurinic or apyrimidinic site) lyase [Phycisphaerales bacterium]